MAILFCPGCGSTKIRAEDSQGRQPCDNCFSVWLIDDIRDDYQPSQLRAIFQIHHEGKQPLTPTMAARQLSKGGA